MGPRKISKQFRCKQMRLHESVYPIAISTFTQNKDMAQQFIDFLTSDEGQAILKKHSYFVTPEEAEDYIGADKPVGGEYTLHEDWVFRKILCKSGQGWKRVNRICPANQGEGFGLGGRFPRTRRRYARRSVNAGAWGPRNPIPGPIRRLPARRTSGPAAIEPCPSFDIWRSSVRQSSCWQGTASSAANRRL